jgi:chromosome segregation ATPase
MLPINCLSRREAIDLKFSLEPASFLYREVERALMVGSGVKTLSNGIKIYVTPENQKLLGGMTSYEAKNVFSSLCQLSQNLNDLSLGKDEIIKTCETMRRCLNILIRFSNQEIHSCKNKEFNLNKRLIDTQEHLVCVNNLLNNTRRICSRKENDLSDLKLRQERLEDRVRYSANEIDRLETRVRKADNKRVYAIVDTLCPLIPLSEGRLGGAIPGISLFRGVISVVSQDKESHKENLRIQRAHSNSLDSQLSTTRKDIEIHKKQISDLETESKILGYTMTCLERSVVLMGRSLTNIENTRAELQRILNSLELLIQEINRAQRISSVNTTGIFKQRTKALVNKISDTRTRFNSIF